MNYIFRTSELIGPVTPPPSKSLTHRALICNALSGNTCNIENPSLCDDCRLTGNAIGILTGTIRATSFGTPGAVLSGASADPQGTVPVIDCGSSASTLRFLLPVASALGQTVTFTGSDGLSARPLGPLISVMKSHGVVFSSDSLPLTVTGKLTPGFYSLPADISSQYLSGLLFALPLLNGKSTISLTGTKVSAAYTAMTLDLLSRFGIAVNVEHDGFTVPGGQHYRAGFRAFNPAGGSLLATGFRPVYHIEPDWSAAAFWLTASAIGGFPVTCEGLSTESLQGDREVLDIFSNFGCFISDDDNGISLIPGYLTGSYVDVTNIPDLLPPLAVLAAFSRGRTDFSGTGRLRYKETDRPLALQRLLASIGVSSDITADGFTVYGGCSLSPSSEPVHVDSCGDHRIAMAAAIAATVLPRPLVLHGAECVTKSYPEFYETYKMLGGKFELY